MNKDKLQLGLKRPMLPRTFIRIAIQLFIPHFCKVIFIDDTIDPQYKPREECNGKYCDNEGRDTPKIRSAQICPAPGMIRPTEPLLQAILRNMRIWQVVHDIVPLSEAVTSDILSPQDLRNLLPSPLYPKCGTYMRIRIPIDSEFLNHTARAMFPLGDRESWIRA